MVSTVQFIFLFFYFLFFYIYNTCPALVCRKDKKSTRIASARKEEERKKQQKEEDEMEEKKYAEREARDAYLKWTDRKVGDIIIMRISL